MDRYVDEIWTLNPTPDDGRGIFIPVYDTFAVFADVKVRVVGYDPAVNVATVSVGKDGE